MCTAISMKTKKNFYFGRNLDLNYSFNYDIVVTPRNYEFKLRKSIPFKTKFALFGMGIVVNNTPLYFETMNEKGLSMAGLNFPWLAKYYQVNEEKINLAPFELIPYLLGNWSNIDEVKKALENINIIDEVFSENFPNAPLHWIITDANEKSIVVETTENGMKVYDNPYCVLTNSPSFDYHYFNMFNYQYLSEERAINNLSPKLNLINISEGLGSFGLPGDVSSSSRFVRAVYNKFNAYIDDDEDKNIVQFFNILNSVSMLKGSVVTHDNEYEVTQYSCCMDYKNLIYYYKSYDNTLIKAFIIKEEYLNNDKLTIHKLELSPEFDFVNR